MILSLCILIFAIILQFQKNISIFNARIPKVDCPEIRTHCLHGTPKTGHLKLKIAENVRWAANRLNLFVKIAKKKWIW